MIVTIQEVARKRVEVENLLKKSAEALELWNKAERAHPKYIAYNEAREKLTAAEKELSSLESQYKEYGISLCRKTGEKWYPGGGIRVSKSYVYDESVIIPFLREHKHDDLIKESIDKTKVKKLADIMSVPGITTKEKLIATLNSDLTEFLEETND